MSKPQLHKRFTTEQVKIILQWHESGALTMVEARNRLEVSEDRFYTLLTWRQTFNATGMSTIYPYADHNGIPASVRRRARGGKPRPRVGRNALGNSPAFGSSAEHPVTRSEP